MQTAHKNKTHGFQTHTTSEVDVRFYRRWVKMRERCQSKHSGSYERYGAKGVRVCERWQDFENFHRDMYSSFIDHVELHGVKNTTLDRINNDIGYCPENCQWATYSEQRNNSSTAVIYKGETATQASLRLGGLKTLVYKRLKSGWSIEKAFTTNSRKQYAST